MTASGDIKLTPWRFPAIATVVGLLAMTPHADQTASPLATGTRELRRLEQQLHDAEQMMAIQNARMDFGSEYAIYLNAPSSEQFEHLRRLVQENPGALDIPEARQLVSTVRRITALNEGFEHNYALFTQYLRDGGAQDIYARLRNERSEHGGYIAIRESPLEIRVVDLPDPSDQPLSRVMSALETNGQIQEEDLDQLLDVAEDTFTEGVLGDNVVVRAVNLLHIKDVFMQYERYRQIGQNTARERRGFASLKESLADIARLFRDNNYAIRTMLDEAENDPTSALGWHHHTMSREPAPPSQRDLRASYFTGPSVVLALHNREVTVYAIKMGAIAHTEQIDGLRQ